jgi:hypothetical protein
MERAFLAGRAGKSRAGRHAFRKCKKNTVFSPIFAASSILHLFYFEILLIRLLGCYPSFESEYVWI